MKVTYDVDTDTLRILLSDVRIDESDDENPGVVLDYDMEENVVGVEILGASQRMDNSKALEFVILG